MTSSAHPTAAAAHSDSTVFSQAGDLRAAALTDAGRVRDGNEDRFHVDAGRGVFLVVDGVGGHAAGEVAATIARDIIVERLARTEWAPAQRVREAIALANNAILEQANARPEYAGMTCVVTLALLEHGRLTIGHVGDSRLYALSRDGLVKLTHDHSPIGEREDAHELSESAAMHHPRRNEVFRDVGSTFHEPDDDHFIEIVETAFQPDHALLLCSDGLSDMLTSTAIERTIRQHAGDAGAVTRALIDAANEAGGRDNVTVVYLEGPRFASTTSPQSNPSSQPSSAIRRFFASRALWLTAGVLAGLGAGLGLDLGLGLGFDLPTTVTGGRQLIVGGRDAGAYASIAAALAAAKPHDVVQVEPGEYPEAIVLPSGVDLVARIPGSVTLVAPTGRDPGTGITTTGALGNRIAGIRILGRPNAPLAAGLRLGGHSPVVDDVTIEGVVDVGMDIPGDGAVVRSSRFAALQGIPLRVGATGHALVQQNIFIRGSGTSRPALEIGADASPTLSGNVFVDYVEADVIRSGPDGVSGARARELLRDNYFVRRPDRAK